MNVSNLGRSLIAIVAIVAFAAPTLAEDKRTVYPAALLSFDERGAGVKDYGAKVSDLLFAKLVADPSMYLVDRVDLQKTLAEQSLGLTGAVNPEQAAQVGQLTGAQLLVTGSVLQVDKQVVLVAKIIGTQTSRVLGASVEGKITDDLGPLVGKLAESIVKTVDERAGELVPATADKGDRLAKLKKAIGDKSKSALPSLWVRVSEQHIGQPTTDPAAETELTHLASEVGFTLIDVKEGSQGQADLLVTGEGFSEFAGRVQGLVAVKARVELKVVDRISGKLLFSDRQTTVKVDLAENIAGKTALQEAGALLAERALPKIATLAAQKKTAKK